MVWRFVTELMRSNERERSLKNRLRRAIPLLGNSEAFLAALYDYQRGRLKDDSRVIEEARMKGLVAIIYTTIEAGFFLSLFGRGALLGKQAVKNLFFSLQGIRSANELAVPDKSYVEPFARRLLEEPAMRRIVDQLFEATRLTLVAVAAGHAKLIRQEAATDQQPSAGCKAPSDDHSNS